MHFSNKAKKNLIKITASHVLTLQTIQLSSTELDWTALSTEMNISVTCVCGVDSYRDF